MSYFQGGPNMGSSSNSGKMTPEPVGFILFNLLAFPKKVWNVIDLSNHARQFVNYSSESSLTLSVQTSDKLNFVG